MVRYERALPSQRKSNPRRNEEAQRKKPTWQGRRLRAKAAPALGLLLTGTLITAPDGASAAPSTSDYSLSVNPHATGPTIDDTMHGLFYEDINHAADGGLYAELVQNRSFEYDSRDNPSYRPMTAWQTASEGSASGEATVADDNGRLNDHNRHYLRLNLDGAGPDGRFGVVNSGFNAGMPIRAGEQYTFSVWARTEQPAGTPLSATLRDANGSPLATPLSLTARGNRWVQYTGTVSAHAASTTGRLAVTAGGSGTVGLDMVSLFPKDTFKGRPNGMRRDLAEKIAALRPGFLRFPGGCVVNTGTHRGYGPPDWPRRRSYQWKDSIGPVEQRSTNANYWGYDQSYGLGYFEYLQFAEDLGATPLPVVPALVTGCGQNQATDDPRLLQRHIQDTLDLIEFATGPPTSPWGSKRAAMGHPAPFHMTHLAIGNEENLPDEFMARFTAFRDAIKARYPWMTLVSNSGPDSSGPTFDHAWDLNRRNHVDMVDEHYYNDPKWFLENNHRYDSYDRNGPKVVLGEYASKDNRFGNSLAESAYMTGLERNADVVTMSSYAPLLANADDPQWRPDMIWFDNQRSWGSTSYETQKLFMNNVGDQVVPSASSADGPGAEPFRQVVTRDERTGELIVKVVNDQAAAARTQIDVGRDVSPVADVTTLAGDPAAVNTAESQPIHPVRTTFDRASRTFRYTFPPHSVTVMRIEPGQP